MTIVEQSVGVNMNERFPRIKKGIDCYRKMARIEDGWTDIETKCSETAISTLCVVRGRSIEYEKKRSETERSKRCFRDHAMHALDQQTPTRTMI